MKYLLTVSTLALFSLGLGIATSSASESTYTIPKDLKPVLSTWRDGWSADETRKYRQEYNDNTLTGGENDGAYAITHLSEVLPTAIVHRIGPVAMLESANKSPAMRESRVFNRPDPEAWNSN